MKKLIKKEQEMTIDGYHKGSNESHNEIKEEEIDREFFQMKE